MNMQTKQALSEQALQEHNTRILRSLTTGLEFLEDKAVIGPTHYSEGLSDLKWLIKLLLSSQAQITFITPGQEGKGGQRIGKTSFDESDGGGKSATGNGSHSPS